LLSLLVLLQKFKMEPEVIRMWYAIAPDELYHYGILGQKWGVRRFQNPDGTLTSEGRKRYNQYSDGSVAKKSGRTKRLEKSVAEARRDTDSARRSGSEREARKAYTRQAVQEARLNESREKDREPANGKKAAVAVGVTATALVATGLGVKYKNEIGAAVGRLKNEKPYGATAESGADALQNLLFSSKIGTAKYMAKGAAEGMKDAVVKKGKETLPPLKQSLKKGAEKTLTDMTTAAVTVPLTFAAGKAASSIASKASKARREKGESAVRDLMEAYGKQSSSIISKNFSFDSVSKGLNQGNKKDAGGGSKGFQSEEYKIRYDAVMQKYPKGSPEKEQIRKMKNEGKSIEEIEKKYG